MESDSQDLKLQKLEEFVYDEDKIITFTWLSNELNIPTSESKQLLEKYVEDQRTNEPTNLLVMYIICGVLLDGKGLSIILSKEKDVASKEGQFQKVTAKSIYSIQKSKEFNIDSLTLVDHLDVNQPREAPVPGSVVSKNCIKRIFKEKKSLPVLKPTLKEKTTPASFFTKAATKSDSKPKSDSKAESAQTTKSNPTSQQKSQTKPQQNGLTSFFAKAHMKKESSNSSPEKENKNNANINGEESVVDDKEKGTQSSVKSEDDDFEISEEAIVKIEETVAKKSESPKAQKNEKSASKSRKSNKRQRKGKSQDSSKKRRRIVEQEDSDSDDIFGDIKEDEPEDIIENSDEETKPEYKPAPPVNVPKNKKRKQVEETTMDDEGYVITKKVWVYESASEEEVEQIKDQEMKEVKPIKEQKKPTPKAVKKADSQEELSSTSNKGKKGKKNAPSANQPTLMNFFKKK